MEIPVDAPMRAQTDMIGSAIGEIATQIAAEPSHCCRNLQVAGAQQWRSRLGSVPAEALCI